MKSGLNMREYVHKSIRGVLQKFFTLPGGRFFQAAAYSVVATAKTGLPTFIAWTKNGWVHQQSGNCIYDATPRINASPSMCEKKTKDNWLEFATINEGDVVIEVGAGIGENTLTFSKLVGARGHVYAIEAHPETFKLLKCLCDKNMLSNVTPVLMAIHSTNTPVLISNGSDFKSNTITNNRSGYEVEGSTLDSFVSTYGIDHIDLIKMNIEGAEADALSSMSVSMAKAKQMVISCHDFLADRGGDADLRTMSTVKFYLNSVGFRIHTRENDSRDYIRYQLYASNLKYKEKRSAA